MPAFPVRIEKQKALEERFQKLGIREADLQETFVRSSGPGGQKTNKSSTCVVILHKPTGLSVKCQEDRTQALNRFLARRILADRVEAFQSGNVSMEEAERLRIRKNKKRGARRRAKAVQEPPSP